MASWGPEPFLSTLRSATDPAQLLVVVEAAARRMTPDTRIAAYSILAQAAGPEAVWAVELARAGSLEEMDPEVLDFMGAGRWDLVQHAEPENVGIDGLDMASVKAGALMTASMRPSLGPSLRSLAPTWTATRSAGSRFWAS